MHVLSFLWEAFCFVWQSDDEAVAEKAHSISKHITHGTGLLNAVHIRAK